MRIIACIGAAICVGLSACTSAEPGKVAEDPAGRFSYEVASGLIEEVTDGTYRKYRLEQPAMEGYVVAAEAHSEAEGIAAAFGIIGTAFDELRQDGLSSYKEWRLFSYAEREAGRWKAAAVQYRGGTLYGFIVAGGADSTPDSLPSPLMRMLTSFRFTEEAPAKDAPQSLAELERYIDAAIAPLGGAVSVAAIQDGKVVYRYASGFRSPGIPASADTAIHWGSITKLVTGTAVMREVERGRIDLDAPIDRYLQPPLSAGRITVRDLLSHTSGMPIESPAVDSNSTALIYYRKDEMPPLEEVWRRYLAAAGKPLFVPGTAAAYNNYNYLALAVILEKVTGRSLTDYAESEILKPLGMAHTAYFSEDLAGRAEEALAVPDRALVENTIATLDGVGYPREKTVASERDGIIYFHPINILPPWGGVKGTAEDAARFGWMFLDGKPAESERILSPKSIAAMEKRRTAADGSPLPHGLAFMIYGTGKDAAFGHEGGGPGIESSLRIYPRHRLAIAVLGSTQGYGADAVVDYLMRILTAPKAGQGSSDWIVDMGPEGGR